MNHRSVFFNYFLSSCFCFLLTALAGTPARAWILISDQSQISETQPTDLFVAGYGDELKNQFFLSATLAAEISKDRFPERQRLVFSAYNVAEDISWAKNKGWNVLVGDTSEFTVEAFAKYTRNLQTVMSLQFFGHNNPLSGFRFESKNNRLWPNDDRLNYLKNSLHLNAFVSLFGCNTAWTLAPSYAQIFERPVLAAFGSSDFQALMNNHQWYFNDVGRYPNNVSYQSQATELTAGKILNCKGPWCLRLKPVNQHYDGVAGSFTAGLGFMRAFATAQHQDLIPRALVHQVLLWPSVVALQKNSSEHDFYQVWSDFMCPNDTSSKVYKACLEAIANKKYQQNSQLTFFDGNAVSCTHEKCNYSAQCKKPLFFGKPCKVIKSYDSVSSDFSQQLKAFDQGWLEMTQGLWSL